MDTELEADIKQLIKVLDAEVGYTEQGSGYTKFGDWYQKNVDDSYDFSSAAWCDMFLAWGAQKTGLTEEYGQFAYTPAHAAWFKEQGAWGTKPEPGALVFYDWSGGKSTDGIDHIGIVTKVEGDRIKTIEGNVDGRFAKRKERDQGNVVGYGYPAKTKAAAEPSPEQEPSSAPQPDATPSDPAPSDPTPSAPQEGGSTPSEGATPSAPQEEGSAPGQAPAANVPKASYVPKYAAPSATKEVILAAPPHEPGVEGIMAAPVLIGALAVSAVAYAKRRSLTWAWPPPRGRHHRSRVAY